jgi:hypothetical protein
MNPKHGTINDADWKSLNDRARKNLREVPTDSEEYVADSFKWRQIYENRHQN